MNFQEKLQFVRKERGFSQEDLAEKIGISRQAVAKWESGQTYPDVDNLVLISNLFKVSIDSLLKTEDDSCCIAFEKSENLYLISEDMRNVLCRAKKATYAGKGAEVAASRPKSHDLQYAEGDYQYIDTYLGGEKFIGEEALWFRGTPVWSMNYCGRVLGEGFLGDFLKEALFLASPEYPYRGPLIYRNGDYTYHCSINGAFEWFQGQEEIYLSDKKVYECFFHGGEVK